jgi:hypothetical protein
VSAPHEFIGAHDASGIAAIGCFDIKHIRLEHNFISGTYFVLNRRHLLMSLALSSSSGISGRKAEPRNFRGSSRHKGHRRKMAFWLCGDSL